MVISVYHSYDVWKCWIGSLFILVQTTGVARKKTMGVHQQILGVPNIFSTECYTSTNIQKYVSLEYNNTKHIHLNNGGAEHGPLGLNVPRLPRYMAKALPEVGVEALSDRRLCQTFPADPHNTFGSARSDRHPPPPS